MARQLLHGSKATITTESVDDSAAIVDAGGSGRVSLKIKNTHGSQTIALGPNSSVSTSEGDHFIGASAIAANGGTFTFTNYSGPVYALGSGASTTFTLEIIRE